MFPWAGVLSLPASTAHRSSHWPGNRKLLALLPLATARGSVQSHMPLTAGATAAGGSLPGALCGYKCLPED